MLLVRRFMLLLGCVFVLSVLLVLLVGAKSFRKKKKRVQNCPNNLILIYITTIERIQFIIRSVGYHTFET